jgi:predicted transcriptional regulator
MLEKDDLIEATQQGAIPVEDIEETVVEINAGLTDLSSRIEALDEETPELMIDTNAD